ncbi:hypothetical protein [Streptomyces sp. NPDC088360]
MGVLEFLFQNEVSTVLTAVVLTFSALGTAMWAMSRDGFEKGRKRKP